MYDDDLKAFIVSIVHGILDQRTERGREGWVVGGSHDPSEGSIEVTLGDTYGITPDDGDSFATEGKVPLLGTHSDQQGPRGGERVVLIPIQSGYGALLHHAKDDSPGAPAGERWIVHRNASGAVDAFFKLTNDGIAGDGKGGVEMLVGSYWKAATAGGLSFSMDDSTGKMMLAKTGLGTADEIVTQTDFQEGINAVLTSVHNADVINFATVQPGTGIPTVVAPAAVTASGSSQVEGAE